VEAAISKVFAGEALQRSAYEALQDLENPKYLRPCRNFYAGRRVFMKSTPRNEDEEMNHLAGFILDKGSYPWDVVL
jgi:hypothetical protein